MMHLITRQSFCAIDFRRPEGTVREERHTETYRTCLVAHQNTTSPRKPIRQIHDEEKIQIIVIRHFSLGRNDQDGLRLGGGWINSWRLKAESRSENTTVVGRTSKATTERLSRA